MKRLSSYLVLILSVFSLLFAFSQLSWAEEGVEQPAQTAVSETPATPVAEAASPQPETQWLWGDVLSVDSQTKTLTVKYLDYDTENERQMVIRADEKTVYENVRSLDEIKPQQTVSVDYLLTAQGDNLAKNISVEQTESEVLGDEFKEMPAAELAPAQPAITEEDRGAE